MAKGSWDPSQPGTHSETCASSPTQKQPEEKGEGGIRQECGEMPSQNVLHCMLVSDLGRGILGGMLILCCFVSITPIEVRK